MILKSHYFRAIFMPNKSEEVPKNTFPYLKPFHPSIRVEKEEKMVKNGLILNGSIIL
jgi:hypothetical protein